MFNLAIMVTAAISWASPVTAQAELSEIGAIRKAIYSESCPAGRLKAIVDFRLLIERNDPALGDDYFPMSGLTGKLMNITEWREESYRSGRRYKQRIINSAPRGFVGALPSTYDLTVAFDGSHSWRYRPRDMSCERFGKVNVATQIVQDYFGDLIGSKIPVESASMSRTIPAPTDEPYDLDSVIASGLYDVVGEESVSEERCIIIERAGVDRIWLAIGKSFSVVRREWRWSQGGPMKRRINNSHFRSVGGGAWVPFTGQMEVFSHPQNPPHRRVGVLTANVETASIDFPDSEFAPSFSKGTHMFDLESGTKSVVGYSEGELAEVQAQKMLLKSMQRKPALAMMHGERSFWNRSHTKLVIAMTIFSLSAFLIYCRLERGDQ